MFIVCKIQILLVYDITKKETFEKILHILNLIADKTNIESLKFGLIGNKTDLYHAHEIKMSEHAEFSESKKFDSFFMSAKTGDQVVDCFKRICISLDPDIKDEDSDDDDDEEGEIDERTKKTSNNQDQVTVPLDKKGNRRTSKCLIF